MAIFVCRCYLHELFARSNSYNNFFWAPEGQYFVWWPEIHRIFRAHLASHISHLSENDPIWGVRCDGSWWPTLWRHDQRQAELTSILDATDSADDSSSCPATDLEELALGGKRKDLQKETSSSAWLFTWRTRLGQMLINPRQVVRIWTAKSKNSAWNAATNRSNISSVDIRRLCREITKMKRMLGLFFSFRFHNCFAKGWALHADGRAMGSVFKASKFLRRFLRSCVPGCFLWGMSSLLSHSRCKMSLDFNTKRIKKETTQGTLKKHSKHSESQ